MARRAQDSQRNLPSGCRTGDPKKSVSCAGCWQRWQSARVNVIAHASRFSGYAALGSGGPLKLEIVCWLIIARISPWVDIRCKNKVSCAQSFLAAIELDRLEIDQVPGRRVPELFALRYIYDTASQPTPSRVPFPSNYSLRTRVSRFLLHAKSSRDLKLSDDGGAICFVCVFGVAQ